jgi:osmotically inducible protein OsmC
MCTLLFRLRVAEPLLKRATGEEPTVVELEKVLYMANVHTVGGRDGAARSHDGRLDVRLSTPGTSGVGTNPEQLFAAGWSACFITSLKIVAAKLNVLLPAEPTIDAHVALGTIRDAYRLSAQLDVRLPGLDRDVAKALTDAAHQTCPYSGATRSNIDVVISVI